MSFGTKKISYTKCGLFTISKLTKYRNIIHSLYWGLAGARKYALNMGFHEKWEK
jgi:hypothetical protein